MLQVMAVGVAASLALSVGGGRVGVSMLTRWRGDRVEILHHTLQVPHLVVQLLRAVGVPGLEDDVISSQPSQRCFT